MADRQQDRIDRLESLVEKQQAIIEDLQETTRGLQSRLDELADDGASWRTAAPVSRRGALKAGGLLALLFGGTATASADPSGEIGTSSDPLQDLYAATVNTDTLSDNGSGAVSTSVPLDLDGNDLEDGGTTIWDAGNGSVPQDRLENASLSVAGNLVSLGGSTGISHSDLSGINANDHHTRPSAGNALADNSNTFDVKSDAIGSNELASDSVTVAGNSVSLGGSTGVAHGDLSNINSGDHHTRPSAGDGLAENSNNFDVEPADFAGDFLSDDGSDNLAVNVGNGLENDGSGNLRVNGGAVAGNVLVEGINPYEVDLNIGSLLTDNSGTLDVVESSISHDNIDQNTVDSNDHHTRPSAGDGLSDSSNTFDISPSDFAGRNLSVSGSNLNYDPPQNVVIVAKSGGDYSDVNTALSNVSGPAVIWVAPGEYNVTASDGPTIPADVSLVGASRRATTLYFDDSGASTGAVLEAPNGNSAIRSLSIEWRAGTSTDQMLQADNSSSDLLVDDVHIEDTGGEIAHGLGVGNGTATVVNSEIRQSTDGNGEGVQVYSGTLTVRNSILKGESNGIDVDSGGTANLANNKIIQGDSGSITNNGTVNKFGNYDGNYNAV